MEGIYLSGATNIANFEGIAVVESSSLRAQLHYHKFVEIVYFERGGGIHIVDGDKHSVSSGDFYILNPFTSHEFHADESGVLNIINIMFYVDFFDMNTEADSFIPTVFRKVMGKGLKCDKTIKYIHLHGEGNYEISRLFRGMFTEFTLKDKGYLKVLHNQLDILFVYLFRDYVNETEKLDMTILQKRAVEGAIKYIDANFIEDINVDKISQNSGFCSLYFNKLFKRYTGESIPQYVRRKRIEYACRLLAQTDKSIEQICIDVGYNDIKHFYKFFKETKKVTPGEYRRRSEFYINQDLL